MNSCEEISDDILSYLTGNIPDSDSSLIDMESIPDYVSTTTECGVTDVSELENHLNSSVNPDLSSVKSPFSSRKLEWDSGADVGYVNAKGQAELSTVHPKLSTIEKMALSSSASKLCFNDEDLDDDDHSKALIAKIDLLLGRNKTESRLPTWPSVESSNGSTDTVVPVQTRHLKRDEISLTTTNSVYGTKNAEIQTSPISFTDGSLASEFKYFSPKVFQLNDAQMTELSNSFRAAGLKEQVGSSPVQKPSSAQSLHYSHSSVATISSMSETSLPFHKEVDHRSQDPLDNPSPQLPEDSSVSVLKCDSDQTEEGQMEELNVLNHLKTKSELEVCKTLRDHLKSLKNYVIQLEKTWQFLGNISDSSKSAASSVKDYKSSSSRTSKSQRSKSISSIPSSTRYQRSKLPAQKNEISFEIEPLNLHASDSETCTTRKQTYSSKTDSSLKCCSHCELRSKDQNISKSSTDSNSVIQVQQSSSKIMKAQKEPLAFEIPLESSGDKLTLQEALSNRRPDFIMRSEARRNAIHQMVEMRQDENVASNDIPRLFTYQQLRSHTERIYKKLPEAKRKEINRVRKDRGTSNRIKAAVFQKELQSRVLQGRLNLPHSTCLVNCR